MKTTLANGIIKLEKLRTTAYEARESFNTGSGMWSEKEVEKAQDKFDNQYHSLAVKFKQLGEDANNYTQWETISPSEFMEEVECK